MCSTEGKGAWETGETRGPDDFSREELYLSNDDGKRLYVQMEVNLDLWGESL